MMVGVAFCDMLASTLFSRVSLSHLRQCLSPETSLEDQRPPAPKRPVEEEDEGEGEEEPKKKLSFGLSSKLGKGVLPVKKPVGISIKLGQSQKAASQASGTAALLKPKVGAAAAVFSTGDDDDDDEEEMPPEAKMRMKNIGRDTPTSAGPNSFGKTRMGFCDSKKIYEKQLKDVQEKANKVVPDSSV
ncbi:PEST proteolytic signal-containing nuclear protein [Chionoecetes opilio]|uniref:PEST proteolytic signal-containing nuclear protein n=1 Tax=Chionoecetes opilio TaxID=41210 RepID=A0A8J4XTI0_CHIOP|nr:PEST proteolytic signal-containing nuclear protein [Chionoecetes opilio]